jgi:hypothetical protein
MNLTSLLAAMLQGVLSHGFSHTGPGAKDYSNATYFLRTNDQPKILGADGHGVPQPWRNPARRVSRANYKGKGKAYRRQMRKVGLKRMVEVKGHHHG